MRLSHPVSAMLLALAVLALAACAPPAGAVEFARDTLAVETAEGERHRFRVEVADSPAERRRGLMFREHLAEEAGMLFLFPESRRVAFWMKNTPLSLDMLFLQADGRIRRIAHRTKPLSLAAETSGGPVRAVLEVKAGTAARLDITVGDRVHHPALDGDS